ncbi:MAG: GNAT family N-acetyltransferase [Gaiellales bacterium]
MTRRIADRAAYGDVVVRRWREDEADALRDAILASAQHLRPRMVWLDEWSAETCDPAGTVARWNRVWEDGGDLVAAIEVDGALAGSVGLHWRIGPRGLEIGYYLFPAWTGRGLATIASGLCTDLAFRDRAIDVVRILHDVSNGPSEGIPRRLGYALIEDAPSTRPQAPADVGVDRIWEIGRAAWPGYASLA